MPPLRLSKKSPNVKMQVILSGDSNLLVLWENKTKFIEKACKRLLRKAF